MHPLEQARTAQGLTRSALAHLAGVSYSAIWSIERGSDYKTNVDTASRIVRVLQVEFGSIFKHEDVSHIGRPPATGKPCVRQTRRPAVICPKCKIEVPTIGICDKCNEPVTLTA